MLGTGASIPTEVVPWAPVSPVEMGPDLVGGNTCRRAFTAPGYSCAQLGQTTTQINWKTATTQSPLNKGNASSLALVACLVAINGPPAGEPLSL
jgi:hypothetical protein